MSWDHLEKVKIGVISDTHITERAQHLPVQVIADFKNVDLVIHAGDMVNLAVIDELKNICPQVLAVAGNMDQDAVRKKYPVKEILEILGWRIGLMHGAGPALGLMDLVKDAFKDDHCDLVIFGHSHKPVNTWIDRVLFFNPGSATDLSAAYNSYGLIELKRKAQAAGSSGDEHNAIEAKIIKIENG